MILCPTSLVGRGGGPKSAACYEICRPLRRAAATGRYARYSVRPRPLAAVAGGIALILFTVGALEHPFGTEFRVGPDAFQAVLDSTEGAE